MIVAGKPEATGRIVSLSEDNCTARVVWRSTPGTFRFQPDPETVDVGYVVIGKAIIRREREPDITIQAGSLIEFPHETFEMEIVQTFIKVSNLYKPNGLTVKAEPLTPNEVTV